jgi:hypothetical protein
MATSFVVDVYYLLCFSLLLKNFLVLNKYIFNFIRSRQANNPLPARELFLEFLVYPEFPNLNRDEIFPPHLPIPPSFQTTFDETSLVKCVEHEDDLKKTFHG